MNKLTAEALASDHRVGPLELQLGDPASPISVEIDALGIELEGQRTALVIIRDVSERARMREQLLRSDRLASLGTLVTGVAHEINNPLTYVLGNLEIVNEGLVQARLAPELQVPLDEAIEGARRIHGIVDGMRTFARPEVANVSDVDLRDVVTDALKLTRHTVKHQAHLEVELGAVPSTRANRARLGQVAVNLIMNAVQAPRPGERDAKLKVVTRVGSGGEARLEIHDNGVGMSREVLARVFDPFFTTKAVGAGTGLGLSICHGIATACGGTIELVSSEGEGTVATLVMPATGPIVATAVERPPRPTSARTARVLIIDDESVVARAMGRMLKGHDVHIAEDIAQVEALLTSGPFDLVLCDLMMPGVTGMELHERFAREAPVMAERMMFMTGGAFTPDAQAFVERMPDRCVLKPISMATLRDLVDKALGAPASDSQVAPDVSGSATHPS